MVEYLARFPRIIVNYYIILICNNVVLFKKIQGGQDILSMMGQLMKPKKTEITGKVLFTGKMASNEVTRIQLPT